MKQNKERENLPIMCTRKSEVTPNIPSSQNLAISPYLLANFHLRVPVSKYQQNSQLTDSEWNRQIAKRRTDERYS